MPDHDHHDDGTTAPADHYDDGSRTANFSGALTQTGLFLFVVVVAEETVGGVGTAMPAESSSHPA